MNDYVTPQLGRTLVEALEMAAEHPERGFSHLPDAKAEAEFVPFPELLRQAQRVAVALQRHGVQKGDRIGIILPESKQFIATMFGAMIAGAIALSATSSCRHSQDHCALGQFAAPLYVVLGSALSSCNDLPIFASRVSLASVTFA